MRVTLMTMQDASGLWDTDISLYISDHLGMFSLKADELHSNESGDFMVLVNGQGIYVPDSEVVQVVYHD